VHSKPLDDRTFPPIIPGAIVLLLLAVIGGTGTPARADGQKLFKHPTPLTRITLSTDIDAPPDPDDPGTGGSFENSTYFQNKLADPSQIRACVAAVKAAASAWANGLGLTPAFEEIKGAAMSIHYVKPELSGLFAIDYQVEGGIKAKVRVDFYRLDATEVRPEAVQELLGTYRIAGLQDALDRALRCAPK
jgi:hypothetical protein